VFFCKKDAKTFEALETLSDYKCELLQCYKKH